MILIQCKYCWESGPSTSLIRPCQCCQPVHISCLRRWVKIKEDSTNQDPDKCEICLGTLLYPTYRSGKLLQLLGRRKDILLPVPVIVYSLFLAYLFTHCFYFITPAMDKCCHQEDPFGISNNTGNSYGDARINDLYSGDRYARTNYCHFDGKILKLCHQRYQYICPSWFVGILSLNFSVAFVYPTVVLAGWLINNMLPSFNIPRWLFF